VSVAAVARRITVFPIVSIRARVRRLMGIRCYTLLRCYGVGKNASGEGKTKAMCNRVTITFRPEPSTIPSEIRVRRLLKVARRSLGLRCVSIDGLDQPSNKIKPGSAGEIELPHER